MDRVIVGHLGSLPTMCLLQKSLRIPGLDKKIFVLRVSVGAWARVPAQESHLVILFFFFFFLILVHLFIWLHQVLVAICGSSVFIVEYGVCGCSR